MANKKYKSHEFSSVGTNHSENEQENQDFITTGSNDRYEVIVLADGVSTCSKSKEGAEIAAKAIENLFLKKGDYFLEFDDEKRAELTVSHMLRELSDIAKQDGINVEEYSSTIAAILVDKRKKQTMTFNLGDSMILGVKNGKVQVLESPSDSRSGTVTTTTRRAESSVKSKVIQGTFDSTILCSDGAWKELFDKNKLRPEIAEMLVNKNFEGINEFLEEQHTADDCSFVALDSGIRTMTLEEQQAYKDKLVEEGKRLRQEELEMSKNSQEQEK